MFLSYPHTVNWTYRLNAQFRTNVIILNGFFRCFRWLLKFIQWGQIAICKLLCVLKVLSLAAIRFQQMMMMVVIICWSAFNFSDFYSWYSSPWHIKEYFQKCWILSEMQFIILLNTIHHKKTIHVENCACSLEGGE